MVKSADPRHILIVTWDFPPADSTGVHLPASIARHAALAGWRVSVVCAPAPTAASAGGQELAESIPPAVRALRVDGRMATAHHARLHPAWGVPSIDGGYLAAVALTDTALAALRDDPPAVVLGSGPRFANFLAARWLAETYGAKLALQYRDEWTVQTPAFVQNSAADRAEEARCLARADLVTFVSAGKEALYRQAFPRIDTLKFMTIANGWEPFFHERARRDTQHLEFGPFTLTYTGRWHSSLQPFLDALEAALGRRPDLKEKLRLVILGRQLPENEKLLAVFAARHPGNLVTRAATSPTTAIEIQRESGALLLLNEHLYDGVVPLKTFDYLCGTRPILVFGATGGAAKIIEGLGAGVVVGPHDPAAMEAALARMMDPATQWDTPQRREWNARSSRAVLIPQLLDALAALTAPGFVGTANGRCLAQDVAKASA